MTSKFFKYFYFNASSKVSILLHTNKFTKVSTRNRGNYTVYNSVLVAEKKESATRFKKNRKNKVDDQLDYRKQAESLPVSLRLFNNSPILLNEREEIKQDVQQPPIECESVQFPFQSNVKLNETIEVIEDMPKDEDELIRLRNEYIKGRKDWMLSYDNFDDNSLKEQQSEVNEINYGTPDPNSKITRIPCGGCGAHLHCKDQSMPGYIPSEIFKNFSEEGAADLTAIICQRCYFLKNYNIALEVQVSEDDYPKVLQTISAKHNAVVVLMVDLTDFPCSIWPGIADIFHKMPIIVVGNKVDLLPRDSSNYLDHVKRKLMDTVKEYGFGTTKLMDVVLISAVTGYGIENLITTLHKAWRFKGNVYLVGCTNVGKSSLFNALIQSDYCKSQAQDLIQRATTSVWPGTTLNLLRFPIAKPSGYKLELRRQRLKELEKVEKQEAEMNKKLLRTTNNWKYTVLQSRIDRSMDHTSAVDEPVDYFSMNPSNSATGRISLGVNEREFVYKLSRWCFDTPGVVQPDQIIHLLTAEELFLTLPKQLIAPRCFCVRPGESLFIGGLARLDLLEGEGSIRATVFASKNLPISLCKTEEASDFYKDLLGTKYFKIPFGSEERLRKWPGLSEAKNFSVEGIYLDFATKDVVLSNAGWISISGRRKCTYKLRAWTPEKRGCHVRDSLLPQSVNLRGPRIRSSPAYEMHKYFAEN